MHVNALLIVSAQEMELSSSLIRRDRGKRWNGACRWLLFPSFLQTNLEIPLEGHVV